MDTETMLRRTNEIVSPHGFAARAVPGIETVGVAGDQRTYGPVVELVLKEGHHMLKDTELEILSIQVTNEVPWVRVLLALPTRES